MKGSVTLMINIIHIISVRGISIHCRILSIRSYCLLYIAPGKYLMFLAKERSWSVSHCPRLRLNALDALFFSSKI